MGAQVKRDERFVDLARRCDRAGPSHAMARLMDIRSSRADRASAPARPGPSRPVRSCPRPFASPRVTRRALSVPEPAGRKFPIAFRRATCRAGRQGALPGRRCSAALRLGPPGPREIAHGSLAVEIFALEERTHDRAAVLRPRSRSPCQRPHPRRRPLGDRHGLRVRHGTVRTGPRWQQLHGERRHLRARRSRHSTRWLQQRQRHARHLPGRPRSEHDGRYALRHRHVRQHRRRGERLHLGQYLHSRRALSDRYEWRHSLRLGQSGGNDPAQRHLRSAKRRSRSGPLLQ